MTEREARMDEVQRALDRMCLECREGNPVMDHPRGGVGHKVLHDDGLGNQRAYWQRCGRANWTGEYLTKRLSTLRTTRSRALVEAGSGTPTEGT